MCPPPVCGVSGTKPGTWAVLQMCSRPRTHLVGSWFPVLFLMSSFLLMTPSKSSGPSQLLARWVGHAHDHCLTLTPRASPFPASCLWLARHSQEPRQEPLQNLENRVSGVAFNQAAGEPLPFPSRDPGLQVAAVAEAVGQALHPSCPGTLLSVVFNFSLSS